MTPQQPESGEALCTHENLNWGSGSYYIFCPDCGQTWAVVDPFVQPEYVTDKAGNITAGACPTAVKNTRLHGAVRRSAPPAPPQAAPLPGRYSLPSGLASQGVTAPPASRCPTCGERWDNGGTHSSHGCQTAAPPVAPAQEGVREALRRLTFAARISGGTAGPDAELMAACDQAEAVLSAPPAAAPNLEDVSPETKFSSGTVNRSMGAHEKKQQPAAAPDERERALHLLDEAERCILCDGTTAEEAESKWCYTLGRLRDARAALRSPPDVAQEAAEGEGDAMNVAAVKCVICGTRDTVDLSVPRDEPPVCQNCLGPMIVERILVKRQKRKPAPAAQQDAQEKGK